MVCLGVPVQGSCRCSCMLVHQYIETLSGTDTSVMLAATPVFLLLQYSTSRNVGLEMWLFFPNQEQTNQSVLVHFKAMFPSWSLKRKQQQCRDRLIAYDRKSGGENPMCCSILTQVFAVMSDWSPAWAGVGRWQTFPDRSPNSLANNNDRVHDDEQMQQVLGDCQRCQSIPVCACSHSAAR